MPLSRLGAWISIGAGLAGMAACTAVPTTPPREGPPASWSLTVPTGPNTTVMVGKVAVIKNDRSVLGVNAATGQELWRIPSGENNIIDITNDLVVHQEPPTDTASATGPVAFSMIDPTTGRTLWRGGPVNVLQVTKEAIFSNNCKKRDDCTTTRQDPRSGKVVWRVPSGHAEFGDVFVGLRRPLAPATAPYTVSDSGDDGRERGARDTRSGRLVRGHATGRGWYEFVIGRTLITTDHDPLEGDDRCTVRISAVDTESGRKKWAREVFSGRTADGECERRLAPASTGLTLIGAGSRIAASTQNGTPQVFDLASGRTVWRGNNPGVPIDGNGRTLLVRQQADQGPLTLLEFASGRARWTAPDPGLSGRSASWKSAVTGRLVAVSGATGDRPYVLVYLADNGQRLGRFPGWLEGLGDDWVTIGHSANEPAVGKLTLDFVRF